MLTKNEKTSPEGVVPDFIVVPDGAIYSSGKIADLYYRGNSGASGAGGVHQVGTLEDDDRHPGKCQYRLLTVIEGNQSYGVGMGNFTREEAEKSMQETGSEYWADAHKLRGLNKTKDVSR